MATTRDRTESGQIIATNRIGGNDYEYRVAKFDNPGLNYRIETRFIRQDGSKGNWEGASMGHYASETNAIEAFLPRFRFGRDDFDAIHPKIIAMQEKAQREQKQLEESRSKKAALDLIDQRLDAERREIIQENFKSAKFKKASTKIVIAADGSRGPEVTGPSINGLVIHQTRQKMRIQSATWGITHMGTGLAIGPSFTAQRDAKIAAWRLSQLADFSKGQDELKASGAQLGVAANRMAINSLAKIDDLHPNLPTPRSPDPKPIKVSEVGLTVQKPPKTTIKDTKSISTRAAIARLGSKAGGRRNPALDATRTAKIVAPAVAKTEADLKLQQRWFKHPNQLDFAGVDTKKRPSRSKLRAKRL